MNTHNRVKTVLKNKSNKKQVCVHTSMIMVLAYREHTKSNSKALRAARHGGISETCVVKLKLCCGYILDIVVNYYK